MASQQIMAIKNDVLIVSKQGGFPPMVREQLQARGFTTQVFDDIDSALRAMVSLKRPVLTIDAGTDATLGIAYAEQLVAQSSRIKCPVLMIAIGVGDYAGGLTPHLPMLHTLSAPVKATEIIETLEFIATSSYARGRVDSGAETVPAPPPLQAKPQPSAQQVSKEEVQAHLFQELADVSAGVLGGEDYIRLGREDLLRALGVVPSDGRAGVIAERILVDAGSWGRGHLMRTAYLALRIAGTLNLDSKIQEHIKEACYLYAWSFAGAQPELLRVEYHTTRGRVARKDICSRVKDSAMNSALEFKSNDLAAIISLVAKLIGQEDTATDDPHSIAASAVAGAELIDRICCRSGHFNPRRAAFLLKKLQDPHFSDLHPAVVACLVKFIGEAVSARSTRFIVPKSIKKQKAVYARAKAHFEEEVRGSEIKVSLADLQPGMKLSRSLLTFDGRELLEPGLTLDADLILRLWGLAALRQVDTPVIHKASRPKVITGGRS